ncbi:glycerophosphodiester phosphodiesterase family protein [Halovulum sp. GXIMD14794]
MTQIASHRGGAALWPENSETAFRETLKLGVEQIEFDVQLSADGEPMIFHDSTLDRVTNGTGPMGAKTLDELKALEISNGGGRILTLDEGLDILALSDIILRCELKPGVDMVPYPGIIDKTLRTMADRGLLERTVITSFHLPTLREVAGHALPLAGLLWLVSDQVFRLCGPGGVALLARDAGITQVAPNQRLMRDGSLETLRDAGLEASAFAVLEDEAIEWAFRQRLPVFTTDRPDAALRIRRSQEAL